MACFAMLAMPVLGQNPPDHETILRQWFEKQRSSIASADTVYFDETAFWQIDAPFGSPTLELRSNVRKTPFNQRSWRRTISATVNDRPVVAARLDEVKQRWHTNTRRQIGEILTQIEPRPGLLERMTPMSRVVREEVDGLAAWRVDVVRRDRRMNLERLTLWFDISSSRLLRTRAIVSGGDDGPSFVIVTNYASIGRFDAPVSRSVEGTVRIKRRSRYFTVLITHSQEFSNFSIVRYTG